MLDFATIVGVIVGLTVVSLAILSGSDFWIFLNLPGFLIVVGGTLAATMIKFPMSGIFIAFPVGLKAAFTNEKVTPRDYIRDAIKLSKIGREQGLVALDGIKLRNSFFQQGVQLCADGREIPYIRKILTQQMAKSIQEEELGAKIFTAVGESAPAFGMFGTLVGLVQMLSNMSDPTSIGPAMAVALLTTLYGVLIANLVALPIAEKLEAKAEQSKVLRALIIECVFQIQQLQTSTTMQEMLEPFLPEKRPPPGGGQNYTGRGKQPAAKEA
jgi:chemotaxis protein MotA